MAIPTCNADSSRRRLHAVGIDFVPAGVKTPRLSLPRAKRTVAFQGCRDRAVSCCSHAPRATHNRACPRFACHMLRVVQPDAKSSQHKTARAWVLVYQILGRYPKFKAIRYGCRTLRLGDIRRLPDARLTHLYRGTTSRDQSRSDYTIVVHVNRQSNVRLEGDKRPMTHHQ